MEGEGAAMGAALHAAWVWQKEEKGDDDLGRIVDSFIKTDEKRRAKPDTEAVRIYRKQKQLYKAISNPFKTIEAGNPLELRTQLLD